MLTPYLIPSVKLSTEPPSTKKMPKVETHVLGKGLCDPRSSICNGAWNYKDTFNNSIPLIDAWITSLNIQYAYILMAIMNLLYILPFSTGILMERKWKEYKIYRKHKKHNLKDIHRAWNLSSCGVFVEWPLMHGRACIRDPMTFSQGLIWPNIKDNSMCNTASFHRLSHKESWCIKKILQHKTKPWVKTAQWTMPDVKRR